MYKTVRQGDNCLQYHILPQDDVTGHVMKRRRPPRSRTALVLVVTLILGCSIVAAAVLIPVLMHANVVTLPARFQTFAVAASSVKMGRGKYTLQGAQYIALLPVKDPAGHLNYQLRPSFLAPATTTTSTSTTTRPPSTEVFRIAESGGKTPGGPVQHPDPTPGGAPTTYMPWMDHKGGVLVVGSVVLLVLLFTTCSLGLCLYLRRRHAQHRAESERDKGALLAEAGEED